MQRLIKDIRNEIEAAPKKTAWNCGVYCYALDLFSEYIERLGLDISDETTRIGKITEEDLLNGSKNWPQYSRDGKSLLWDVDICHRLCSKKDEKKKQDGKLPPNDSEDWLDFQARALQQAAQIVICAVNRRGKGKNTK